MKLDGLHIAPIKPTDFNDWLNFSLALFTQANRDEMEVELRKIAKLDKYQTYIAKSRDRAVGYATVTLRTDHVEGATSSPVGYLEAIYVDPAFRDQGVARDLFNTGEKWCRDRGCTEMGSDTWHWNKEAQEFHKRLGIREEDILVHFYKKIDP